jgi:hypothetical protein
MASLLNKSQRLFYPKRGKSGELYQPRRKERAFPHYLLYVAGTPTARNRLQF